LANLARAPRESIHQGLSVDAERCVMAKELRKDSRGDDPIVPIVHLYHAIAPEPRYRQLRRVQTLACHRLDRITPDHRHRHVTHALARATSAASSRLLRSRARTAARIPSR